MKFMLMVIMMVGLVAGGFYVGTLFQEDIDDSSLSAQGFTLEPITVQIATGEVLDLSVAIADESDERTKGLQSIPVLLADEGMWFIFDQEEIHRFWMKDMEISLDILFVNRDFTIVSLVTDAPPCAEADPEQTDCAVYSSVEPSQYVLEVKAGTVERYGLAVGDRIQFSNETSS